MRVQYTRNPSIINIHVAYIIISYNNAKKDVAEVSCLNQQGFSNDHRAHRLTYCATLMVRIFNDKVFFLPRGLKTFWSIVQLSH